MHYSARRRSPACASSCGLSARWRGCQRALESLRRAGLSVVMSLGVLCGGQMMAPRRCVRRRQCRPQPGRAGVAGSGPGRRRGAPERAMRYFNSILETVGRTPLVRLNKLAADVEPLVLAKVEYFNPGGRVKDRISSALFEACEQSGAPRPAGTILAPTGGNT